MIGKFLFFYLVATAFGSFILREKRTQPIDRIANTRRLPEDVLNILGSEPALRTDDYVKLPKEVFDKWFAKHQQDAKPNDNLFNNLPQPTDVTTEYSELPIKILDGFNKTGDKPNEFKIPDVKEDLVKTVAQRYVNDFNAYNPQKYYNNYNKQESNESAVKRKLLQLIRDTKSSIDKKIEPIQAVHDAYKLNKIYKIGYLVSNINRTQDNLREFYNHVEKNAKYWDGMKVLNAYDQVKTADEFLSKALYILNVVGNTASYARVLSAAAGKQYTTTSTNVDGDVTDRLAWSYYDDNM